MSTRTGIAKPAPVDVLAALPVGARFAADGKVFEMADGFTVESAAGRGVFNAVDRDGITRKVQVCSRTRVIVLGTRTNPI